MKQLDLGLVKKGLPRLDQTQRRALLPIVTDSISKGVGQPSAAGIFNLFLRLLLEIQIPPRGSQEDVSLRTNLGLADSSDARYVSQWLGKLFLFRQELALAPPGPHLDRMLEAPDAGLTKEEVEFLRMNDPKTWKPGELGGLGLPECKLKAIAFLASGAFSDDERFLPALCASGSTDSRITAIADDVIKRCRLDLESRDVVQGLYELHGYVPLVFSSPDPGRYAPFRPAWPGAVRSSLPRPV